MAQELAGKVTVITGGANGLGKGMAELFIEEGAKVVIGDIDSDRGAELARKLGKDCRFLKTDVTQASDMQALVDLAVTEFGRLDGMCNNAGAGSQIVRLLEDSLDQFDRLMHVNVLSVMRGTQMAARHMRKTGGGAIVNVSSVAGALACYGIPIYRTAKAGVIHFTKMAAIDLGEYNVRVNCILPGQIDTGLIRKALAHDMDDQEKLDRYELTVREHMLSYQPLKRRGQPRDTANAAMFLVSERSTYVTGAILPVDGGIIAGDSFDHIDKYAQMRKMLDE